MAAIAKNDESERREKRGQVFFSHPNERVNEMKEKAETLTSGLFFFSCLLSSVDLAPLIPGVVSTN